MTIALQDALNKASSNALAPEDVSDASRISRTPYFRPLTNVLDHCRSWLKKRLHGSITRLTKPAQLPRNEHNTGPLAQKDCGELARLQADSNPVPNPQIGSNITSTLQTDSNIVTH